MSGLISSLSLGGILTKILCLLWVCSSVVCFSAVPSPHFLGLSLFPNISASLCLRPSLSLSGALQLVSMHDQLQTRRALLLCDWTDREYAVGNGSC